MLQFDWLRVRNDLVIFFPEFFARALSRDCVTNRWMEGVETIDSKNHHQPKNNIKKSKLKEIKNLSRYNCT